MAYLTVEEYKELTNKEIDEEVFNQFINKASAVLDSITNYFYQFQDLETDIAFRKNQFKKALCAQVDYFIELDADTYEGLNNSPQSVQIGDTSISYASRYNPSGANESKSLDCEDAYLFLQGTGLLYRGVPS